MAKSTIKPNTRGMKADIRRWIHSMYEVMEVRAEPFIQQVSGQLPDQGWMTRVTFVVRKKPKPRRRSR